MPKYKQKFVNDLAKAFGMTVSELAENIGYSKQSIYLACKGLIKLNARRLLLAQHELERINENLLAIARARAIEEFEQRKKLIDEFVDRLSIGKEKDDDNYESARQHDIKQ